MKKTVQYVFTSLFISILGIGGYVLGATTFVDQFGGWGVQGGFNIGNSISKLDQNGNVYVVDSSLYRFQKFAPNGTLLYTVGAPGTGNSQFDNPSDIAIGSGGILYVVDRQNNRVQRFDANGTYLGKFGSQGNSTSQFQNPTAIAIGSGGLLYVVDSGNNRVQKFDANGSYLGQFGSFGNGPNQFQYPNQITIDSLGNIYVTDQNLRTQKFDTNNSYLSEFGSQGSGDGQFQYGSTIIIGSGGIVYAVDEGNHRIQRFSNTGSYLSQFGIQGTANGQFANPTSISIDANENLYVIDNGNSRIQKFSSTGSYLLQFGTQGNGDNQYQFPTSILISPSGNIYVGDNGNNRIKITDLAGNYIGQFNGYTTETQGKLRYPNGAKIYNGKVYIPDTNNNRIQIYSLSGTYLSQFGTQGSANGQFQNPSSIAISTGGIVYVSDNGNNRIQKFDANGIYIGKFGSLGNGSGNGEFQYVPDIAVDGDGNIHIIDSNNNRIQKFTNNGVYLSQFGSRGIGNGQFNYPSSIDIGTGGIIYVADPNNYRVQKFDANGIFLSKIDFQNTDRIGSLISDRDNNIYVQVNTGVQKFTSSGTYITQFDVGFNRGKLGIDTLNNMIYITDSQSSIIKRYRYTTPTLQPIIKSYSTGQINPILTGIAGFSGDIITIYSGSSVLMTGQVGSGNMRTLTVPVTLSTGSLVFPWKLTDSENNSSLLSTLTLIIDKVAPVVTLLGSGTTSITSGSVFVDPGARWTDAIDGSGSIMTGTASGNILNTSVIGTYYLKYTYTDRAGNTGNTVTRTISVVPAPVVVTPPTPTPSGSSGGGGGGGGGLVKDNCPVNEDYSPSYYDRTCGTKPAPIIAPIPKTIEDITNNFGYPRPLPIVTRSNKTSVGSKSSSCDTYREDGYSEDLYNSSSLRSKDMFVICWMFDNKMTTSNTLDSFQGSNLLRRDASTKFFYNFITNVLFIDPITINTSCNYNDLKDSKVDLLGYIKQSCNIGLYKGSDSNKSFFPRETFKKSRFSIVMSNVITLYNADTSDNSKPSLNSIKELQNKDARITRIEAAHALYKLSNML